MFVLSRRKTESLRKNKNNILDVIINENSQTKIQI